MTVSGEKVGRSSHQAGPICNTEVRFKSITSRKLYYRHLPGGPKGVLKHFKLTHKQQ
jgi:hypothetical protein